MSLTVRRACTVDIRGRTLNDSCVDKSGHEELTEYGCNRRPGMFTGSDFQTFQRSLSSSSAPLSALCRRYFLLLEPNNLFLVELKNKQPNG